MPATTAFLFNVTQAKLLSYKDLLLLYTLQGLVNRGAPRLFFDTGAANNDFPQSDERWVGYLMQHRGVTFKGVAPPSLCTLVEEFDAQFSWSTVVYHDDNYSEHIAATAAGINGASLPVSEDVMGRHSCLRRLPVQTRLPQFTGKLAAYRWAIDTLLPNCSRKIVFNADNYNNAVGPMKMGTVMSLDYPISQGGFIMNLSPLWVCDPLDCKPPTTRRATPHETALFVEVVSSRDALVSVWGWGDPEHAYTNITTHAGGVVFCSFYTANIAFWSALGVARRSVALPLPHHDAGHALDPSTVYIAFETNEGDTPRILSSQFTGAWLSPHRGRVPIAWAVDPYLGELLPELWNALISTATANDSFVAGVDGAGYVYIRSLSPAHALAYEARAGDMLRRYRVDVADVGVPQAGWPAVPTSEIALYARNARSRGGNAPAVVMNACAVDWGQGINTWIEPNGPLVVSSVCNGPANNDTTNGHYLYYYRSYLSAHDPAADLAWRIRWAADKYKVADKPLFLQIYGGLGLFGGKDDLFLFVERVLKHDALRSVEGTRQGAATTSTGAIAKIVAVGAQEMARLAREAHTRSPGVRAP